MLEILYNDYIAAAVNTMGAELWSLKRREDDREFLWQGDKEIWPRRAPILFPITGALKEGKIRIAGKDRQIPMHGFARDYEHEVISADAEHLRLRFTGNETTEEIYPYHYELEITYQLAGRRLDQTALVRNTGRETMYFSIGFHTGFFCPPGRTGSASDCVLRFADAENPLCYDKTNDGLITGTKSPLHAAENRIPAAGGTFPDTLILDHPKSSYMELFNTVTHEYVRVHMKAFPYLLVWSNRADVPFVCIEPWYGLPDLFNADGSIEKKTAILALSPGETFTCTQGIEISPPGKAEKLRGDSFAGAVK